MCGRDPGVTTPVSDTAERTWRCSPRQVGSGVFDVEREAGEAFGDRLVELPLVLLIDALFERARERVADVGQDLDARLNRIDIVAVELFRVVAISLVVGIEPLLRLRDHVRVVSHEEIELAGDQFAKSRPPKHR